MDYNSIKTNDKLLFLELDLQFPHETAMHEILTMPEELFTLHRETISNGWYQFVIYGTSYDATQSSWNQLDNTWTPEALKYMPQTVNWFQTYYPSNSFSKIKLALLKPGGSISEHRDQIIKGFATGTNSTVNIAVNNPEGAIFHIADTIIPFKSGSAMLIDFGQFHSVVNNSSENRFHLLVGQKDETDQFKKLVVDSYR